MGTRRVVLVLSLIQCMLFFFFKLNASRQTSLQYYQPSNSSHSLDASDLQSVRQLDEITPQDVLPQVQSLNQTGEQNVSGILIFNQTIEALFNQTTNLTIINQVINNSSILDLFNLEDEEVKEFSNQSIIPKNSTQEYEKFKKLLSNFTRYKGLFEGLWHISETEDPSKLNSKFSEKSGKAHFEFEFNTASNISHINVYGSVYDGDFRNNEVQMEFFLSPLYNHSIDPEQGRIIMRNINITLVKKSDIKLLDILICGANIELQANLQDTQNDGSRKSSKSIDDNDYEGIAADDLIIQKDYKIYLVINQTDPNSTCLPSPLKITLKAQSVQELIEKISNYSFIVTAICMIYVYCIMGQIKKCMEHNQSAKGISVPMLCFNLIWNFCYFTIHFENAFQRSYYHYLSLPSFWYFMICFVFEFRLILICWKAQNYELFRENATVIRKKLIFFYCKFYVCCVLIYIFHAIILYQDILLLIFCGSIWLPQIYRQFMTRSRSGPEMYFVNMLTISHSFFPMYVRGCPYNLFEREPSYLVVILFVTYLYLQIQVVKQQQLRNPRFFVPKKYRINRNAYNYFVTIQDSSHVDVERQEIQNEEDCIICMNSLRYDIDQPQVGNVVNDNTGQPRKAKQYMKTPCNHKYHVQCLKTWMEIRLECPACRQAIPALEVDDD